MVDVVRPSLDVSFVLIDGMLERRGGPGRAPFAGESVGLLKSVEFMAWMTSLPRYKDFL